ncbi:Protein CBG09539 [Caenorhabditis briggsae]|uniref:Protein CBG09539 n=1 Tax=Caenorhabditis briggsae TaxID=6238 RepID=A8X8V3_CAEBR|nr:Protein CBG09539 [Caenorhabditis briggsae]CAP29064.2 Protein CBG09539 [Caenorhabditis briggsae]
MAAEAEWAQLPQISMDLNPIHQLCQPCILVADAVKDTNKSPIVKEAEKKTCNTILKNDLVCNGAVEVAGIYLNWTPSQKICENFQMCAPLLDNKKMRAPAKGARRPDEAFENDEFPILQSRFARQTQNSVNLLEIPEVQNFEKCEYL